jgi:signal transduction histidine kinase
MGRALDALSMVRADAEPDAGAAEDTRDAAVRWELAAAAAGFGVFEWNVDTDMVTLDAPAAALFGCRIDGPRLVAPRAEIREYVVEDDRVRLRATAEAAVADGRRVTTRFRVRGRDGQLRHVQIVGRVQHDRPGARRLLGVVRDVSAEEQQGQLASQRDSALAVAKARMDFVSRLSHELRTPLNAIVGFAELMSLDEANALPAPQAQRLQHIVDASVRLRDLVDDMLDLSKIDAGAIPVSVRLIDAAAVLHASIAMVDTIARQHGVRVENHLDTDTPMRVYADPQRLQQVFVNLLTNGCKYNKTGGELVVSSEWNASGLVVHFADTGVGIAPQDVAELGRPFRRVGRQAARVAGTGLGLYIVKLILDRMGAGLDIRSELGLGSTFSVTLPIKPPA